MIRYEYTYISFKKKKEKKSILLTISKLKLVRNLVLWEKRIIFVA